MLSLAIDVAFALLGHMRGGPAKASVVSSALNGVVSGSSIANVVTGGVFTISLMKRVGYTPVQAGAIETSSSVNGQLMPPVMGAGVFISRVSNNLVLTCDSHDNLDEMSSNGAGERADGVGGHVRRDVPEIVEAISREHPGVAFRIASALGEEASVQDAMARASVAAAKA